MPKDGPSAGITMATAMLSAVTGKASGQGGHDRGDNPAWTGPSHRRTERKILAAKMAHIEKVLVPDKNRPDMAELSKGNHQGLDIVYVKAMEDVVSGGLCLERG